MVKATAVASRASRRLYDTSVPATAVLLDGYFTGRTVVGKERGVGVGHHDVQGIVDVHAGVVPLDIHVVVPVGFGTLVEVFDPLYPVAGRRGVGLFVDEPAVEAVVFGNLVHLLGIGVGVALFGQHLFYPFRVAAVCLGREEHVTQNLHTVHVAGVDDGGRRRNDDTLAGRAAPPDDHIDVLPVSGVVADEVVGSLRGSHATHGVHGETGCYLSFGELILMGLDVVALDAGLQFHGTAVEFGIGVLLGGPVLDVVGVPATAVGLLGKGCGDSQGAKQCSNDFLNIHIRICIWF